ncbi:MAG: DUF3467 domain-containing protein [Phycisphaerae bacterium]|nr:DUF3467 domain-containing protein [Phycisphaerae bacterium]
MANNDTPNIGPEGAGQPLSEQDQARQQTGQQQVQVRVDERNLETTYANAFRTNATAEEVMMDFGLNIIRPTGPDGQQPEITFQVTDRVILSPYSAKRLAVTLSQLVRRHEQQFGELELDVAKRRQETGD